MAGLVGSPAPQKALEHIQPNTISASGRFTFLVCGLITSSASARSPPWLPRQRLHNRHGLAYSVDSFRVPPCGRREIGDGQGIPSKDPLELTARAVLLVHLRTFLDKENQLLYSGLRSSPKVDPPLTFGDDYGIIRVS